MSILSAAGKKYGTDFFLLGCLRSVRLNFKELIEIRIHRRRVLDQQNARMLQSSKATVQGVTKTYDLFCGIAAKRV